MTEARAKPRYPTERMSADDVRNELAEEVERGQRCAFAPVDLSIDYALIVAARDRIEALEKRAAELEERCLYGRWI